jgi:cell division septation protein DedD
MRRIVSAVAAGALAATIGLATLAAPAASARTATRPVQQGSTFDVVAGSFVKQANAQRQVNTLSQKGFSGFTIRQVQVKGQTFNRVLRSFSSKAQADALAAQLKAGGIANWINRR